MKKKMNKQDKFKETVWTLVAVAIILIIGMLVSYMSCSVNVSNAADQSLNNAAEFCARIIFH